MTRWDAVLAGVALACLAECLVWTTTGRVTVIGGLAGSAFAGYVASDASLDGAWHGLLTALAWGTVLIPAVVVVTLSGARTLPFPFEFVLGLAETAGEATTLLVLGVTLPNVLTGAAGSLLRGCQERRGGRAVGPAS
jgi:hypothetical protein